MTENCSTALNACCLFDFLGKLFASADTFCNNNDEVVLAALLSFDYLSDNIVYCEGLFLSNNVCRTAGDTCIESYVACISAHNLNYGASVV